jgi:hypothetical protein
MKPVLKVTGSGRLKLKYDKLSSNVAFKFSLRRYTLVSHAGDVYAACLLSARDAPLRRSIDSALQLALDFRAAMRRAPPVGPA